MKITKILSLLLVALFIYSCSDDDKLSDSYKKASKATTTTGDVSEDYGAVLITIGNKIENDGGADVLAYGICYSETDTEPTIEAGCKYTAATSFNAETLLYADTLKALKAETNYYYRSYALNSQGVSYGEVKSVITGEIPIVRGIFYSEIFGGAWYVEVGVIEFMGYYLIKDVYGDGYDLSVTVDAEDNVIVSSQPAWTHASYGPVYVRTLSPLKKNGNQLLMNVQHYVSAGTFGTFVERLVLPE
ncbi:hypothetical protein D0T53_08140 [Dysgonomonas sp. 216]|uniref:hypothetical protein n=1 Tax=Dysgonomonas sp. 216 TaxID=2302934 RepID=UPI0013D66835|nr:hypothetical protein [Dysgonomonas sp. 216]NDW18881.1 hypothetical protein [Dysgonomonas sp. 216]